jgi:hypothetical protein
MEQDFNTMCEDNSPVEIGEILCQLWRECGEGNFVLCNNIIARSEASRAAILQQSLGLERGDEIGSDDEDVTTDANGMVVEEAAKKTSARQEAPPVDEDGFATVVKKSKRGQKPK